MTKKNAMKIDLNAVVKTDRKHFDSRDGKYTLEANYSTILSPSKIISFAPIDGDRLKASIERD